MLRKEEMYSEFSWNYVGEMHHLQSMNTIEAEFLSKYAPIGICAIDAQERFYFVNSRVQDLWRKSQSEVMGQRVEFLAAITGPQLHQRCRRTIATQRATEFEDYSSLLDRWFSYYLYPSHSHLLIYFQDISAWKQIEIEYQQLLVQEQEVHHRSDEAEQKCSFLAELSRILATSLDYTTTLNTIVEMVVPYIADFCLLQKLEQGNLETAVAVHRDPQKQKLVNTLAQLYPRVQHPDSSIWQAIRSQQPLLVNNMEQLVDPEIGDPALLEVFHSLQPRSAMILPLIARGNVVGTLLFVSQEPDHLYGQTEIDFASDIAHRAAMAIDNAQLYQKAQESNRIKTEFLSNLSHELRTPLHLIQGWAKMINTSSPEESLLHSGLEVIERKAKELQILIYDLLDTSQIARGQFQLNPAVVDLSALIQEVIHSFQVAIAAKSIQLRIRTSPCEATQFQVWGDSERLRQVLWHLLSNAIKFTPQHGQVLIELSVTDNAVCELKIVDTGKGIKPEFLPYVFEQFRQADGATTRLHEGLGLGLSLVKYLIELHGGSIEITSAGEGQGTMVKIELAQLSSTTN
jgi:signal transduction histidine kinase/PAS domain-containing protein